MGFNSAFKGLNNDKKIKIVGNYSTHEENKRLYKFFMENLNGGD